MAFQRVSQDRSTTNPQHSYDRRAFLALLFAVVFVLGGIGPSAFAAQSGGAPTAQEDSVQRSVDWLMTQQAEDGGFVGFSGESDPGATCDAVIALAAAAHTGAAIELEPAIDYLRTQALVYTQFGPGSAAKLVLALVAAGEDPSDFEKVSPLAIVQAAATRGQIGNGPYDTALGLLALAAAGSDVPAEALAYVQQAQLDDGSWSFDGVRDPGAGDTNTTALMVQALVAVGGTDADGVALAMDYLLPLQNETGGFPYQPESAGDTNSTSLVLQALLSLDPNTTDPAIIEAATAFVFALQNESGSFGWMLDQSDDNLFATLQAIPAVSSLPLPVYPAAANAMIEATPVP